MSSHLNNSLSDLAAARAGLERNLAFLAILGTDPDGLWAPPMGDEGWDHQLYADQSSMVENVFKDDLLVLAAAGDLKTIAPFMLGLPRGFDTLNRLPAGWLCEVFESARHDVIAGLLVAWVEPAMRRPAGRSGHYSEALGACVGVSIARARGDGGLLAVCDALMAKALDASGHGAGESIHHLLSHAIDHARPGMGSDFCQALAEGARLARSNDNNYLPTFASRMQGHFDTAYDKALAEPGRMPGWIECAGVYLDWCSKIDLSLGAVPSGVRAIGLCLPFALCPELAAGVGLLCALHAGPDGFRLSARDLASSQNLGLPFHTPGRSELFSELGWEGRPVGPVDLALLLGSEPGAAALLKAGVPWSSEGFIELTRALEAHPTARNDYVKTPYKIFPVRAACQRARMWAERWVLNDSALDGMEARSPLRM